MNKLWLWSTHESAFWNTLTPTCTGLPFEKAYTHSGTSSNGVSHLACRLGDLVYTLDGRSTRCPIQRPHTLKDIEGKPGHMVRNVRGRTERPHTFLVWETENFSRQPCFWSHDFYFLNKPIMYGAACLLYGAAISDSVKYLNDYTRFTSVSLCNSEQ